MAKDSKRLLGKTKKRKIKENIASDESVGVYKSSFEFENIPAIPRKGKNGEMILVKAKKRKIKMKRTSVESIGVCESPSEFQKGSKTQKGKNGERLLVKVKKRKMKKSRTSDESIAPCDYLSEFGKGHETQKSKDDERLLGKTKKRKKQENKAFDESIGVYKSSVELDKRPTKMIQIGKDGEKLLDKAKKRKMNTNRTSDESIGACDSICEFDKGLKIQKGKDGERLLVKAKKRKIKQNIIFDETIGAYESPSKFETGLKTQKRKFKKNCKHKKKHLTNVKESNTEEVQRVVDEEKVDEISSVDDDCTSGMKKWLAQYKESRPGLKVLQQRIDEFVTAHEEQLEQERKEREAHAAEDGWTVVVHQKGRKKTTDAETGTVVGSVATSAVMDKMSKKKSKEVGLDFYRFQRREAKRNELMMLQSKFEQDKKRIQQLRAARKFRPY